MGRKLQGLSLIELLVVVAIFGTILAVVSAGFLPGRKEAEVKRATDSVVATLQLARSRTVASQNLSSWGVRLESDRFTLFRGLSFPVGEATNEVFLLVSQVTMTNIALNGGGVDVIFLRPNGITNSFGTFQVASKSSSNVHTVRIESSGIVGVDTLAPAAPLSPYQDARHVHLTLGWSIQNSTTLTLTFLDPPNPSIVSNIVMAPYFNLGKSRFDWMGTVNVNGANQALRIHTHTLNAGNTVLSVVRDRRFNDKAVTVAIDGNAIVSYTAGGIATVGAQGGTMEIQ